MLELFFGDRAFCQLSWLTILEKRYDKELDFKQAYMDVSIALQIRPAINETEAGFVLTWRQSAEDEGIEFDWNVNLALMWICG
ncbi:hypothetical protein SPFM20_00076 [Salmonella phage SPFM20]|nr:hypothetical protein SPFM20_00076 [Salmonella phage SPFM20]